MRNAWLLTLNILKINLRKKATIITFFILPIFGILLSVYAYGNPNSGSTRIGVMDQDHSLLSADLIQSLRFGDKFKVTLISGKEVNNKMTSGTVDCVVIIPNGFATSIYKGQVKKAQIVSLKGESASAWVKNYLNALLQNLQDIGIAAAGNQVVFQQIYKSYQQTQLSLKVVRVKNPSKSQRVTLQSLGFLILLMLVGVGNSIELILKEKRNRTYHRICSAPVSSRMYILGNVFANLIIVIIQAFLAILMITKVFGVETGVPFWQLGLILVVFGLAGIGLGLMIVAFSKDTSQAGILQNLIILPTCFITGCFWPPEIMPKVFQRMADFLPQRWALAAIQKLQSGASFNQVFFHIGILLAFALVFFLITAYLFSRSEDMKTFV